MQSPRLALLEEYNIGLNIHHIQNPRLKLLELQDLGQNCCAQEAAKHNIFI